MITRQPYHREPEAVLGGNLRHSSTHLNALDVETITSNGSMEKSGAALLR